MIHLRINGTEISAKPGRTILEAAREHGFSIPTLCHHPALKPVGACRLCVVEVLAGDSWRLVSACTHPCSDGIEVRTHSEGVLRSRRITVELLLASAAHVPLIQQLAEDLDVAAARFTMEQSDCILCGLCVRACKEIVGVGAISLVNRGIQKQVGTPFLRASGDCIECGTCVLICPTGAISFADITAGAISFHEMESDYQGAYCRICGRSHDERQFADHVALLQEADQAVSGVEE